MKLTNAEIFNVKEPLARLAKEKLPIKTSLAVLKLINKINEHLIPASTVKNDLIARYGTTSKEGEFADVPICKPADKDYPKFIVEYQKLCELEVDIDIDTILLPDTLEIEASVLMALEKFVKV